MAKRSRCRMYRTRTYRSRMAFESDCRSLTCEMFVDTKVHCEGQLPGSDDDRLATGNGNRRRPGSSDKSRHGIVADTLQPTPGGEGFGMIYSRSRSCMRRLHSDSRPPGSDGCRSDTLLNSWSQVESSRVCPRPNRAVRARQRKTFRCRAELIGCTAFLSFSDTSECCSYVAAY